MFYLLNLWFRSFVLYPIELAVHQKLLIKKYNNLTITDKCVQIFTYDVAIPYLLKKPSCNKYFFLWNIGNKKNQNLFIESIENRKPNFILLGGDYKN